MLNHIRVNCWPDTPCTTKPVAINMRLLLNMIKNNVNLVQIMCEVHVQLFHNIYFP